MDSIAGDVDEREPAAGGKSIRLEPGQSIAAIVARTLSNADVRQSVDYTTKAPQFFQDGAPKMVMVVPLRVNPTPDYPDGQAGWWVKGRTREELCRAMQTAGVPPQANGKMPPPEEGALITITCTGTRNVPNMSPAKIYEVTYQRPASANGQQQYVLGQRLGSRGRLLVRRFDVVGYRRRKVTWNTR